MTTSDPQADRRDDDPGEHRSIGQRIRDAVLGDPDDEQRDASADPRTGGGDDLSRSDAPHGGASGAPGYTESGPSAAQGAGGYVTTDTGADRAETDRGYVDRTDSDPTRVDQGYADRTDRADSDGGDAGSAGTGRGGTGRGGAEAGYGDPAEVHDTGRTAAGYDDRTASGRADTGTARDDRDFVTSSYDPDRDGGHDPQAAGTAMTDTGTTGAGTTGAGTTGAGAGAGATVGATAGGDVRDRQARDVPSGQAYDTRGYDPATDTGYPDADRADADRSTGHRDADYDTGRVDAGDRDTGHTAALGAAGAVAAGAVAAGAVAAHRRQDDRGDTRFSEVDDTATVDRSSTGRATADTAATTAGDTAADRRAEAVADEADDSGGGRERLVPTDRAHEYSSRWDALKGDFVDEPRRAVAQADDLVGELLDEIQRLFADQRRDLERGFDHDRASTEDLRLALRRYRSFFDRLLSF